MSGFVLICPIATSPKTEKPLASGPKPGAAVLATAGSSARLTTAEDHLYDGRRTRLQRLLTIFLREYVDFLAHPL
jgi:hypothetical protein